MAEPTISVLLVDDHSLVRRGFRRMLEDEPDIKVVGEASDGEEAVKLARTLKPNVVVMDCALPGINVRRVHGCAVIPPPSQDAATSLARQPPLPVKASAAPMGQGH